jgi:MFS family permease
MSRTSNLLIRNRDFRLVWCSQVLSQAGSRAFFINLLWWIISSAPEVRGGGSTSTWASGILLTILGLPSVLLVRWIGRVLERYSGQKIMVFCEVAGALLSLVVFGLSVSGNLTLGWVYGLSGLIALCQALVDPALVKVVPELVEEADIEAAVGLESSTQALAYFSGAAIGAIASGILGFSVTTAINALSYGVSAFMTSRARFRPSSIAANHESTERGLSNVPSSRDGWVNQVGPLLKAFGAANVFMFPIFLVLPLFVKDSLQGSVIVLGLLESCFWFGLVAGANQAWRLDAEGRFLKMSAILFFLFGSLICSIALNPSVIWAAVVLVCGGISAGVVNVKVITYFQLVVPESARAKFFAQLQAYVAGAQPLSYLLFTGILLVLSPVHSFAVIGFGLAMVGVFCWWYEKRMIKLNAAKLLEIGN